MSKVSILGAGSWGSALAILLANKGQDVLLWSKHEEKVELLKKTREVVSLPGVTYPDNITFTSSLEEACTEHELIVIAVASPYVRTTAREMKPFVKDGQIIVNVAKGIEEGTLMTLCEIIEQELPNVEACVLSGPSHAEEVCKGIPTTCVVGAKKKATAIFVQDLFMTSTFRVYTSPDIVSIELGGSLKNVIALAAGITDGLGYGDNTKAALMTRGIAEVARLGMKMGGKIETFSGLSGIGDLIVTCTSLHSRNRNAGFLIGQGRTMEEAMAEVKQVVEGVYSAKAALALSKKYEVPMPIVEQINLVLFEGKSPKDAVNDLLLRDRVTEYQNLSWEE
ncbi:glycerol-3-phosphate dehydrogenase [NAD(P)+] [Lachnospiraceae bacterium KM106-2]|nr:glycerol-3-phosphate dehydrogenase [NAD(P)+] [Lachnospiraceae bacterium KM106-2]